MNPFFNQKNFSTFFKKVLAFSFYVCYYMQALEVRYALVAQLDRVTDYESVGRGFESLPAYQKSRYPFGYLLFCYAERLDSKGRPCQRQGKKVSSGHFLSPWESPWIVGCNPQDCRPLSIFIWVSAFLLFAWKGPERSSSLPAAAWPMPARRHRDITILHRKIGRVPSRTPKRGHSLGGLTQGFARF